MSEGIGRSGIDIFLHGIHYAKNATRYVATKEEVEAAEQSVSPDVQIVVTRQSEPCYPVTVMADMQKEGLHTVFT